MQRGSWNSARRQRRGGRRRRRGRKPATGNRAFFPDDDELGRRAPTDDERATRAWPVTATTSTRSTAGRRGKPGVAHTVAAAGCGRGKALPAKTYFIDDREIDIREGETIFRAARRLASAAASCYSPQPGYRPDGNCRVAWSKSRASACLRRAACGRLRLA